MINSLLILSHVLILRELKMSDGSNSRGHES